MNRRLSDNQLPEGFLALGKQLIFEELISAIAELWLSEDQDAASQWVLQSTLPRATKDKLLKEKKGTTSS